MKGHKTLRSTHTQTLMNNIFHSVALWFSFQFYIYLHHFLTSVLLRSCWNRRCAHLTGVGHHSYWLLQGGALLLPLQLWGSEIRHILTRKKYTKSRQLRLRCAGLQRCLLNYNHLPGDSCGGRNLKTRCW